MQHGIVVSSAAAVLLLGAVTAVVLHRGGSTERGQEPSQLAALSQGDRASATAATTGPTPDLRESRPVPPSFDVVKVGPSGTAVIAGRAEPGSKVTVRDGDKVIGEVTTDRRGEWVLVPEQPIGAGDRLLSLEASSPQGGASIKSDETVALSIAPSAPGGKGETALAVVLPRESGGAARVLQRPGGESPTQPNAPAANDSNALSMDAVEYDPRGRMVLSGHAKPGATVQIYIGNEPVATAQADAEGAWSTASMQAISRGRFELRIDQLDGDGRVAQRLALPLAQAIAAQLPPGQSYIVRPGNSLWQIARSTYGNGVRYLIIYSANLGQIRDPERIYPGQVLKLPKS